MNENCKCKRANCPRHGKCDECKAFHKEKGNLTTCQRLAKQEEN